MKKITITFFLILSLLAAVCSPASADVITAMAIEVNPEHLEKTASYARILGYNADSNTLTVELIAPEVFDREDVLSLQEGDSIYTNGREVMIESVSPTDACGVAVFNQGEIVLFENNRDDCFNMMAEEDDYVWTVIAELECPVKDSLLFLDYVHEETGNSLTLPVVHTAQELTAQLQEEDASEAFTVGLSTNNVYVVFDEAGQLAVIIRYYVPWQ